MFFLIGIGQEEEKLDYVQTGLCPCCGHYGRYEVYRRASVFRLFFIPLFRFDKQYYVRMSCCSSLAPIQKETGRMIERGEVAELRDLSFRGRGKCRCSRCGYPLEQDFEFCPKCGGQI